METFYLKTLRTVLRYIAIQLSQNQNQSQDVIDINNEIIKDCMESIKFINEKIEGGSI